MTEIKIPENLQIEISGWIRRNQYRFGTDTEALLDAAIEYGYSLACGQTDGKVLETDRVKAAMDYRNIISNNMELLVPRSIDPTCRDYHLDGIVTGYLAGFEEATKRTAHPVERTSYEMLAPLRLTMLKMDFKAWLESAIPHVKKEIKEQIREKLQKLDAEYPDREVEQSSQP